MGRVRSVRTAALQSAWLAAQLPAHRRFRAAAADPERAVELRLRSVLRGLTETARGRELDLGSVRGLSDLGRVPVSGFPDYAEYVDRIAAGESGVLTSEPVEMLETTSGSGGAVKLVPYTSRLRGEFAEAVAVWMTDLHRSVPALLGTRSYWSVSRAMRRSERTAGGVRIGLEDDAEYFDPVTRRALGRLLAVPGDVARSPDLESWRLATAQHLVQAGDLGLISVWSPSFWTRLWDWMVAHAEEVREGLRGDPAIRFRRAMASETLDAQTLWPRLQVVSAWGDGFARELVGPMMRSFRHARFQPKGLLATEGVVSIPLGSGPGQVLALTSHVLELRDVESGRVCWPWEVSLGDRVQPLLTTGGGLVRYALPDVVEVVGWYARIPRVQLVGRVDRASDLVGEKLTEAVVAELLADFGGDFRMLVPATDPLRYVWLTSEPVDAERLDRALCGAHHYAVARELEQLAPVEVRVVPDGWARWERAIEAAGLTLGDQKPGILEVRTDVAAALSG